MPGLRLSYWNPRLLRTVFHQLQQQQQTGLFCDVTLQGDDEASIHVHSSVIAACSPYLANLLMGTSEISKISDPRKPILSYRSVLRIHGIKSLHLFPLVHYMYTAELEVAPRDVSDVLKAAQKLQIPELELLKLEGGRLVRSEPGRRLNRNCLGSKTHAHYAKVDKQANAISQGIMNSGTNIEIKPSINRQNKIGNDVTSVRLLDVKQSKENTLDIGTSSSGMPDNLCFSDVLSSGRSTEDFANSDGFLENMPRSYDLLPYAPSNQNSQEHSKPCSDIKGCTNSQDLEKDSLYSQDFAQDVITNHNSLTVARSLDLMECKLKGSFDNAPSCQDLSEQRINMYGLLDNVQFSQDSRDNEQSIGGLAEDMQSLKELPEDVQIKGELPNNMNDVGEWPEAVQSIEELPKVVQGICDSPEDVQSTEELPESMQSSEGLLETGARGEDTQLNLLNRCKQKKSNPEVMSDQERECSVKPIQSRYRTKSKKGLLKRIRLNRKREEIASVDTKLLKFKNSEMNCNNIDISVSDKFGIVDKEGLTSNTHHESDTSGTVDSKGLTLSSHCEPETNATVDHEDHLKASTYYESKQSGTALLEDLSSITHCESETSGTVDLEGLTLSTDYESKQSGSVDHEDSPSSTHCEPETSVVYKKIIDESRKRQHNLDNSFENNLEKVKLRKANDGLSWEVVKGVESINIAHPIKEKEHFKKLEEQVQQILNATTPISPDLDVGVYSPPMFLEKCVWPDLSSEESDIEIDILG